jgi:hypothetical protein
MTVEIRDFVGAFTSLANEFERYVKAEYPKAKSEPRIFVREVRHGCIEADMITGLLVAAIPAMDQILILEDFVRRWGVRFKYLQSGRVPEGELNSSGELKDWADAAKSISSDPVASHRLQAMRFKDGKRKIEASFEFTAPEARAALEHIEDRRKLLAKPNVVPASRVLMVYTRTDVDDAALNKKSGERVIIRELSDQKKSVMYASEIAENEIRNVIRDADENVYKKGVVVDVAQHMDGDNVVAYSVTALHSVIDLDS